MSIVDEVKQRTDITTVIGQYTKLTKAGRYYKALCPFHSERQPSFIVYPEQQSWHCFGACNTGGDVFSFIMKKEGMSFGDALRLLAERAGVDIPSKWGGEEKKEEKEDLYQINQDAAQYFHNLLLNNPAAEGSRNYLNSRGFSMKSITDFQLGFSLNTWDSLKNFLLERGYPEEKIMLAGLIIQSESGKIHDRFRGRLIFPIHDIRGRTVGFGARALDDSPPKYLNSPQTPVFNKSSVLYGIDYAAGTIRQQDMAVIVEGYVDVITAHQHGITNAVASMGTAITDTQVNTLKKLTRNLALALDADAAGEEAMLRGVSYENILDAEIKVVILPTGKDPDDVIKEDINRWQQLVGEALPIIDYTFDTVISELDLTTARGKSLAVERLLPIIAETKDTTRQTHYLHKLAALTQTNYRNLETGIQEMKPGKGKSKAAEPKTGMVARTMRRYLSSPVEEYGLALLLQHPELSEQSVIDVPPEYFQNSENREIFTAWQQSGGIASLKDNLDTALHEFIDYLLERTIPGNQIENRYDNCVLRLRENYLKNLEEKRAAKFTLEAELGGADAALARLEEEGIEPSIQLREVFLRKVKGG